MSLHSHAWEHHLLSLAYEALHTANHVPSSEVSDQTLLAQAYTHCEALTAQHSRSFYVASALLPATQRRAVRALYAFCRVSDDIVDNSPAGEAAPQLQAWRQLILAGHVDDRHLDEQHLVAMAWTDTCHQFHIPPRYAEQLIEGVARDLRQVRYETFADLTTYAYGVASTVGLMSMHIIGFAGPTAIPYAVKLGVALQLTNILRDVGEDWQAGRLYLPREDLEAFGLSDTAIGLGRVDDHWRAFMRFQIERNRRLYHEAMPGVALLNPAGRLAIVAAARLYEAILDDIERHDYNVFQRRAYVSGWGKLRRMPAIWWQSKTARV